MPSAGAPDSGAAPERAPFRDDRSARDDRRAPASLQSSLRRARLESAERSESVDELRTADYARLDLLRERLEPVLAETPDDCDLFDLGIAPGEHPRLFVDMIAFIEIARDRRSYRFVQDTRHGRVVIAESEGLETMTRRVADYVARRLVEREKALAADALYRSGAASRAKATSTAFARETQVDGPEASAARAMRSVSGTTGQPRKRSRALQIFSRAFVFLIEALGSAAFFALLAAGCYWLWMHFAH